MRECLTGAALRDGESKQPQVYGAWVFWAAVGVLLLLYAWVASQGLLWFDTDSDWVKQAALVKLVSGRFATPMGEGNIPHASLVYHWYPLYPAVLVPYLRLAGTSHAAHLWFDLGLNSAAAAVGAWWLVRRTGSGCWGAIYLLGTPFLATFKLGRPETLTSLFAMLAAALTVCGRRQLFWLVGICLGCAVAASYPAGLACCVAWAAFVLAQGDVSSRELVKVLGTGIVAAATALAVWLYVVYPHWREAAEALAYNTRKLGESYGHLLSSLPATPRLVLPLTVAIGVLSLACWGPWRLFGQLSPDETRLVRASFWAVAGYLGALLVILRRPVAYYFPPLAHLVLPLTVYLLWRLGRQPAGLRWSPGAKWITVFGAAPALAWLNVFLLRAALLPLGWTDNSMTPATVKALLEATVPRDATLRGDGKLLTVVGTNWHYISLNWTGTNHWPQYVVSLVHPRTLEPTLYGFKGFGPKARARIEGEYEPVPTQPATPTPCEITRWLRGRGLPTPDYKNCDWFVRIWKRRAGHPRRASQQHIRFDSASLLRVSGAAGSRSESSH